MVKHIILWKLKQSDNQEQIKAEIKQGLESLVGVVPGLIDAKVICEHLDSSTADLMLDTTFVDKQALVGYKDHPAHVAVADGKVRPNVEVRMAYDFEL